MEIVVVAASALVLALGLAVRPARRTVRALRQRVLAMQAAADAERGRLSHELHDEVGQKLIALKMQLQLSRLHGGASVAPPETSLALLDSVIEEVRLLSHALRPAPFDEGQLVPALTALAKAEGGRAGVCVLVDAEASDIILPRDVELVCYRVVREAFANISKHARARHVAVAMKCDEHALSITVSDDGRGFDVGPVTRQAVVAGRLGLVGMQERIGQVGGTLTIRSDRGAGTTVSCRVPMRVAA